MSELPPTAWPPVVLIDGEGKRWVPEHALAERDRELAEAYESVDKNWVSHQRIAKAEAELAEACGLLEKRLHYWDQSLRSWEKQEDIAAFLARRNATNTGGT